MKRTLLLIATILFSAKSFSQSSSGWVKISSPLTSSLGTTKVQKDASYVTLKIEAIKVFTDANWYSKLVSNNRQLFVSFDLSADINGAGQISDKRSSEGIDLKKYKTPIDMAWHPEIVNTLPTSFNTLNLSIHLNSTSQDRVDEVVSVASTVSNVSPISRITPYIGIVTGAKALLDAIFDKQLAKSITNTHDEFMPTGYNGFEPGFYVAFSADDDRAYNDIIKNSSKLIWDGNILTYGGNPISITYYVISVQVLDKIYETIDFNVLTNQNVAWTKLYQNADDLIDQISDTSSATIKPIVDKIRQNLMSAKVLLDQDQSFTGSERRNIANGIKTLIEDDLNTRNADIYKSFTTPATASTVKVNATDGTQVAIPATRHSTILLAESPNEAGLE